MAQVPVNGELLKATKELSAQVSQLSNRLSAKELLAKRTRMLTIVAIFVSILAVVGGSIAGYAVYQNAQNAKTSCLNANESREAQRNIWDFVYNANTNSPDQDEEGRQLVAELQAYTDKVFAERDCNDLSKRYPLPPPPDPVVFKK